MGDFRVPALLDSVVCTDTTVQQLIRTCCFLFFVRTCCMVWLGHQVTKFMKKYIMKFRFFVSYLWSNLAWLLRATPSSNQSQSPLQETWVNVWFRLIGSLSRSRVKFWPWGKKTETSERYHGRVRICRDLGAMGLLSPFIHLWLKPDIQQIYVDASASELGDFPNSA